MELQSPVFFSTTSTFVNSKCTQLHEELKHAFCHPLLVLSILVFFSNKFVYFRYNKSYYFLLGISRNFLYMILYRIYSFRRKSTIAERFTCYKRKFYKHSHNFFKCKKLLCQYLHDYILFVCLLNVQYCTIKIMHCKRPSSKNLFSKLFSLLWLFMYSMNIVNNV